MGLLSDDAAKILELHYNLRDLVKKRWAMNNHGDWLENEDVDRILREIVSTNFPVCLEKYCRGESWELPQIPLNIP